MTRLAPAVLLILAAACGGGGGGSDGPDASPDGDVGADASGLRCQSPRPLVSGTPDTGDTSGGRNLGAGSCQTEVGGGDGRESYFAFTATVTGEATFTLEAEADLSLYVLGTCGDGTSELACAEATTGGVETVTIPITSGTTYTVVVDGFLAAEEGAFTLRADAVDIAGACAAATTITGSTTGTTVGGSSALRGSCTGGGVAEQVYAYTTPGAATDSGVLTVTLDSATDQGVYVRGTCLDANRELTCRDAELGGTDETFTLALAGATPLTLVVDGFAPDAPGPFALDLTWTPAVCGDDVVTGLEACEPPGAPGCAADCTAIAGTEASCEDLLDEDGDDLVDCSDPTACQTLSMCVPGPSPTGATCAANTDCVASAGDPLCLSEAGAQFPHGMCSEWCDPVLDPCTTPGTTCEQIYTSQYQCFVACSAALPCTRPELTCVIPPGMPTGICAPGCRDDDDCPTTGRCDTEVNPGACTFREVCGDGLDNDFDGAFDCTDVDCEGDGCPALTEVEPNDTAAQAEPYVAPRRGKRVPSDTDFVSVVVATAGSKLEAKIAEVEPGGCDGTVMSSTLSVLGADGSTTLASADGTDVYGCPRLTLLDLPAGTYLVRLGTDLFYQPTYVYELVVRVTPP